MCSTKTQGFSSFLTLVSKAMHFRLLRHNHMFFSSFFRCLFYSTRFLLMTINISAIYDKLSRWYNQIPSDV